MAKNYVIIICLLSVFFSQAQIQTYNNLEPFKVQTIDTAGLKFRPTTLYVLSWDSIAPVNGVPMLAVKTKLEQIKPSGMVIELSTDTIPRLALAALIKKRDVVTGRIIEIDAAGYKALLSVYGLKPKE